jgi:C_GCAxxG_C_C family probable redox protein
MKNSQLSTLNSQLIKERAERAKAYFQDGYNCSQSVFMAYADLFDLDVELASKFASSFGGGMGRLREVCGACTGMFMVASMAIPADNKDAEAKKANYALVQQVAEDFRQENGSIICRELLGLTCKKEDPTPSARTQEYYKKRPCGELVYLAAEIVGKRLMEML